MRAQVAASNNEITEKDGKVLSEEVILWRNGSCVLTVEHVMRTQMRGNQLLLF